MMAHELIDGMGMLYITCFERRKGALVLQDSGPVLRDTPTAISLCVIIVTLTAL